MKVKIEDADPEMVEFLEMEDMMGAFSIQLRLWADDTKNVDLNKAQVHMRKIVSLVSGIGDILPRIKETKS